MDPRTTLQLTPKCLPHSWYRVAYVTSSELKADISNAIWNKLEYRSWRAFMTDLVEKSDYFDMAWSVVGKSFPVFSSYLMVIATWEMSSTYYPSWLQHTATIRVLWLQPFSVGDKNVLQAPIFSILQTIREFCLDLLGAQINQKIFCKSVDDRLKWVNTHKPLM